ncbi:MAG: hypothetical protein EAZ57_07965 [Cytophagales bacterium]|nr:MAG: hypothetical protein EAZ67_09045 [Cytophagales bacterium]TAF60270.1 MAG: hypothetical protein EAZ57_07965 [Cytophagales bacterium]
MEHKDQTQNKIDNYLQKRMSNAEKAAFEAELEQNPELRLRLEEEQSIMLGFKHIERLKLKNKLKDIHQSLPVEPQAHPTKTISLSFWRVQNLKWAAAAVLLAVGGTWFALSWQSENQRTEADYLLGEVLTTTNDVGSLGFAGSSPDTLYETVRLYKPLKNSSLAYSWAQDTLCIYAKSTKELFRIKQLKTDQQFLIHGQDTFELQRVSQATVLK